MTHVFVTRMLYTDDDRFYKRLELYKKYTLKSLREQTNKNFDIAVLCNRKHATTISSLNVIPFFVGKDNFGQKDKTWHCKVPWSEIEGLKKYDIQSNIDSDDFVSKEYVELIQSLSVGDKSIHIHFQPVLFNHKTGEYKDMNNKYNESNGSAFCSLYQPNKDNYIYIGQDGHRRIQNYTDKTIIINKGYAFVGIHDNNDSTTWGS
jgi:hypothetical protein